MATSFILMLSLSLLILVVTHGCYGEDQENVYQQDDAVVTRTEEISQVLQSLVNTTLDVLRLNKLNTDAIVQIKEEMRNHNDNENLLKKENDALTKVITLTQQNEDLKNEIETMDNKVVTLNQEIASLKKQLSNQEEKEAEFIGKIMELEFELEIRDDKVRELTERDSALNTALTFHFETVEELVRRHSICEQGMQELEQKIKNLNNSVETQKPVNWTQECEQQQHLDKIKEVVRDYNNSRDWEALRGDMYTVLDNSSEVYSQLQRLDSLVDVAYSGSTELAALLLCAGLPVDTPDNNNDSMLHAAAFGAKLQMMKLLLDYEANVNWVGKDGDTPLMMAARNGSLEGVKLLVQAGASTTARNNDGYNALYYAKLHHQTAVIRYLEQLPH